MLAAVTCSLALLVSDSHSTPRPRLSELRPKLDAVCQAFHGRMGYSLTLLKTGEHIDFHGDERFSTASTIKTAVALEAIREIDTGKLNWTDKRVVPPDAGREASMWSYFFKDGVTPDVDGWVNLMITVSDNTAVIVLRKWLTPDAVNADMETLGLHSTKVLWDHFPDSQPDLQQLRKTFGLGVTTPNEMAKLLELVYRRRAASPAGCDRLMRILSHQYWDDLIGASAPVDVKVANKSGAINDSRSDTAIVFGPEPYVLTIYTGDQKDQSWTPTNEGEVAIKKIADLVWAGINPKIPNAAVPDSAKFRPTGGGA